MGKVDWDVLAPMLFFGGLIVICINAVLLRAACHFAKEKVPDFGKAFGIMLFVGLFNGFSGFVFDRYTNSFADYSSLALWGIVLAGIPAGVALNGLMFMLLLPTTFMKGVIIDVLILAVVFGTTAVVVLLLYMFGLV